MGIWNYEEDSLSEMALEEHSKQYINTAINMLQANRELIQMYTQGTYEVTPNILENANAPRHTSPVIQFEATTYYRPRNISCR